MSTEKTEKDFQVQLPAKQEETFLTKLWDTSMICINTLQHGMVAITCFYTTWYCIKSGFTTHLSWHTFLSLIGYQLLMVEGIMVFYKQNSYTFLLKKREHKNWLHTLLLVLGSGFAVAGTLVEWIWRERRNRHGWNHRHAMWGIASIFLLAPTMLSGICALFPKPIKRVISPLLSKTSHNLLAVSAFVTGMVSIVMGWTDLRWCRTNDPGDIRYSMAWMTAITTAIALFGPAKTFVVQAKAFFSR